MSQHVSLPDGTIGEFPDTMSDDDIKGVLRKKFPVPSAAASSTPAAPAVPYDITKDPQYAPKDPGAWNALKRVGMGVLKLPGQILDQGDHDQDEQLIDRALGPHATLMKTGIKAAKRLVLDPARAEESRAEQYDMTGALHPEQATDPYNGSNGMAFMHRTAGMVPLVGPLAASAVDRKVMGDASGAYSELGALVATPKVLEKVGGAVKAGVGKVAYPMADRMMKTPTGTGEINPVDAFTPKEIKDFAEDPKQGPTVNMTPAEITESGGLRAVQGIGQKSLFGKGLLQERQAGSQSAVIGRARGLMKKVAPNETNTVQTARALKQQVEAAGVKAKAAANTDYANWRASVPGSIDIDLSDINAKYGNMLNANKDIFSNIPADQAGKLKSAMGKASNFGLDDFDKEGDEGEPSGKNPVMDLDSVREMRSHWLDALRDLKQKGRADSREAGLYSDIVSDLDGSIEKGLRQHGEDSTTGTAPQKAAAGDNLIKGWRNANASWKKYIEDFHGDDSVLADIANTPQTDLVKLPGKILEKGTGGNPVHISQLREHGIGLGGLQREVMDRALNSGFRTPQNKLAGFDDDFLQHVFADNPKDLDALYKTARVGKSVGVDYNPSNTAGALNARSEFEAPAKAAFSLVGGEPKSALVEMADAIPGYGAAKLSTSNWFKNWMTRTPKGPIGKWLLNKGPKGGPTPPSAGSGGGGAPVTPKPTTPGAGGTGPVTAAPSSTVVPASSKLAKSAAAGAGVGGVADQSMADRFQVSQLQKSLRKSTDPAEQTEINEQINRITEGLPKPTQPQSPFAGAERRRPESGRVAGGDRAGDKVEGLTPRQGSGILEKKSSEPAAGKADTDAGFEFGANKMKKTPKTKKDDINLDKAGRDLTERMKKLPDEWADEGVDPDSFLRPTDQRTLDQREQAKKDLGVTSLGADQFIAWKKANKIPLSDLEHQHYRAPQTVGSTAGAKSDTAHYQQAARELGAGASISDVAKRAQELKDEATKVGDWFDTVLGHEKILNDDVASRTKLTKIQKPVHATQASLNSLIRDNEDKTGASSTIYIDSRHKIHISSEQVKGTGPHRAWKYLYHLEQDGKKMGGYDRRDSFIQWALPKIKNPPTK